MTTGTGALTATTRPATTRPATTPRVAIDLRAPADVERLLHWTCALQMADLIVEAAEKTPNADARGQSRDGCAAVERYGRLGAIIDGSRHYGGVGELAIHADAELVYRTARAALDGPSLMLARDCARKSTRPDWRPFAVVAYEPAELAWKRGAWRPRVRKLPSGAEYCVVAPRDRARELARYRERYLRWHAALTRLEAALLPHAAAFKRWRLVPWPLPERPWEG